MQEIINNKKKYEIDIIKFYRANFDMLTQIDSFAYKRVIIDMRMRELMLLYAMTVNF